MARNPFAAQMAREERVVGQEIGARLTQAMRHRRVQQQADAATTGTSRRPPSEVTRIFERALERELRSIRRSYAGMTIEASPTYVLQRTSWVATVAATARFLTETRGGATHCLANGDTLWRVSERYYGHGAYWPALADENPALTHPRLRLLISGAGLRVPRVDCARERSLVPRLGGDRSAPRPAARQARQIRRELPSAELELGSGTRQVRLTPQCVGPVRVQVTLKLQGSLKAEYQGMVPITANVRNQTATVQAALGDATASFEIQDFTPTSLTISSPILGQSWTTSCNLNRDGSFGISLAPKSVEATFGNVKVSGSVGFEVSVRIVGWCRDPQPAPVRVRSRGRAVDPANNDIVMTLAAVAGILIVVGIVGTAIIWSGGLGTAPALGAGAEASAAILAVTGVGLGAAAL